VVLLGEEIKCKRIADNMFVEALFHPGVAPGSQLFTTPGTYNFTVPFFNTLTVHVWGAGGAGGSGYSTGYALSGSGGNSSAFGISVTGGGGGAGGNGFRTIATAGGQTGNSTNGNITNISGGAGLSYSASPTSIKAGGAGANGGAGGAGGAGVFGGSNGGIGSAPGGGGGASYYDNGGGAWAHTVSGGGGGYGQSRFTSYTYVPGTTQTIVVGAGGVAANGDISTSRGGNGAPGRVLIVWT
jgi:hypothetical protein